LVVSVIGENQSIIAAGWHASTNLATDLAPALATNWQHS